MPYGFKRNQHTIINRCTEKQFKVRFSLTLNPSTFHMPFKLHSLRSYFSGEQHLSWLCGKIDALEIETTGEYSYHRFT